MLYRSTDSKALAANGAFLTTNPNTGSEPLNSTTGPASQKLIDAEVAEREDSSLNPILNKTSYGKQLVIGSLSISSFDDSSALLIKLGDSVPVTVVPRRMLRTWMAPCVDIAVDLMKSLNAAGIDKALLEQGLHLLGLKLRIVANHS